MGKKGKEVSDKTFLPMPTHWPGKISDPDLFAQFVEQQRLTISATSDSPFVALRISQIGLKNFTDFMIVVRKSLSLFGLQIEISKHQFQNSVSPEDIVIFKNKVDNAFEKIENRILKRNAGASSTSATSYNSDADNINHVIGIPNEYICTESDKPLISFFPKMKAFKLPPEMNKQCTTPVFGRDLMMDKEPYTSKRTKRYNDTYAEDKTELKAASKPLAKIQDYDYPTFPIFFDVKEYCKIKTYKSNFEQLLKMDRSWIMKPVDLDAPREQIFTALERDYIHNPLLMYEFGRRRPPISTNAVTKDEDADKKKEGGLSLTTIAFLKNKSKVKKTDADKRIINRPAANAPLPLGVVSEELVSKEGLQIPNSTRASLLLSGRITGALTARDSMLASNPPTVLVSQDSTVLVNVSGDAFDSSKRGIARVSRVSKFKDLSSDAEQ